MIYNTCISLQTVTDAKNKENLLKYEIFIGMVLIEMGWFNRYNSMCNI